MLIDVLARGLAQVFGGLGHVEQIVNHLEHQPDRFAVTGQIGELPIVRVAAHGAEVALTYQGDALKKRVEPAYVFGIPLYGRRVVFVLDNSLRNGDPHRFGTGERLRTLCEVPGRRPILHMRLLTVGQFARAHYKRAIRDLPKGSRYELIVFNASIHSTFGKFASASSASRNLSDEVLDTLKPDDGIATYGALTAALDMGGSADSKAWKKGPDEIVFMTCNMPTTGEIKDADVVGAAIALKARLRMVPIHTIGIESHPYGMLGAIAKETGGVYRNYYE